MYRYDEEGYERLDKKTDDAMKKAFDRYQEFVETVYDYEMRKEQMIESFIVECKLRLRLMYGYSTEQMRDDEFNRLVNSGKDVKELKRLCKDQSFCIRCNKQKKSVKVENNICEGCKKIMIHL